MWVCGAPARAWGAVQVRHRLASPAGHPRKYTLMGGREGCTLERDLNQITTATRPASTRHSR